MHALNPIFFEPVRRHMATEPLIVPADAACATVVERMTAAGASAVLVIDSERRLVGIVTARDVAERVAFKLKPDAAVQRAMTAPAQSIYPDELLYRAVARARRLGLRFLPVVDRARRVVGMFDLDAALARGLAREIDVIERIAGEDSVAGLAQVKAAQVQLADTLLADGLPATEVQTLFGELNLDIHRRLVGLVLEAMAQDGWGEAPLAFNVILMGSIGRGESLLFPDQDNGFIIDNYPDADQARVDRFFVELAERTTKTLAQIGYKLCRGNVMATNPAWRRTLSQWQRQVDQWIARCSNEDVLNADIAFDFRPACGPDPLSAALRQHIGAALEKGRLFLREMCLALMDQKVALKTFGGFETEDTADGELMSLKLRGTMPLVGAVRLLALRAGVAETSTLARIAGLKARGILRDAEAEDAAAAYRYLSELLLRQQLADFKTGRQASGRVSMAGLSPAQRDQLSVSLETVDSLQRRVREDLTGQVL